MMRRPTRRGGNVIWSTVIALVVVLGVLGVVLSRGERHGSAQGIRIGEHWHAALGVFVCDRWLPNPPETPRNAQKEIIRVGTNVYAGLHTHGDGLIHFEPQSTDDTDGSATVGRYFRYNGWTLSSHAFAYEGRKERDGDQCAGKLRRSGSVLWTVNRSRGVADLVHYTPHNGDRIVLAFVPAGTDVTGLGDPPSAANLARAVGG